MRHRGSIECIKSWFVFVTFLALLVVCATITVVPRLEPLVTTFFGIFAIGTAFSLLWAVTETLNSRNSN